MPLIDNLTIPIHMTIKYYQFLEPKKKQDMNHSFTAQQVETFSNKIWETGIFVTKEIE